MNNKNNNNNKNKILYSTSLYKDEFHQQHFTAVIPKFNLCLFSSFLRAFRIVTPFVVNAGTKRAQLIRLLRVYTAYYLSHNYSIIDYLYGNQITFSVPSFVMPIFQKVACQSRVLNKGIGYTVGKTTTFSSITDVRSYFNSLTRHQLSEAVLGTEFTDICKDEETFENFKSQLILEMFPYEVDNLEGLVFTVIDGLSQVPSIAKYPDRVDMFLGILEYGVSKHLNLHKFLSVKNNCYIIDQPSFDSMNEVTKVFFLSVLGLWHVHITNNSTGETLDHEKISRSNDRVFSIPDLEPEIIWEFLISTSYTKEKEKIKTEPRKKKVIIPNTSVMNNVLTNNASEQDAQQRRNFSTTKLRSNFDLIPCIGYGSTSSAYITVRNKLNNHLWQVYSASIK